MDADPYEMKACFGMPSIHRKRLEILSTCMEAIALGWTSYVLTGHRTIAARAPPSRPG